MYALGANVCGAPSETITIDEALQRIRARTRAIAGRKVVPLCQAQGRILATNMKSMVDVPAHDSSAMDGYALHAADLFSKGETVMRVRGRAAAGRSLSRAVARGEAARIFTGAPMPAGADTVVIQENCCREGASVRILSSTKPGANVRRAGEDVSAGAFALASGRQLGPEHLALAAAVGHRALCVTKRLKVALFSNGDELREPGDALVPGQVYDANRFALLAELRDLACETVDLGILKDDAKTIRATLADAARESDLILTSGGMSDGEEDHVKAAVRALGELDFWSLAIKPGRPVGMGRVGSAVFMGLPGNPVAAIVAFAVLVRPMVLSLSGASDIRPRLFPVRSDFCHQKPPGRREYLCAHLDRNNCGEVIAQKLPRQGSHRLSSLAQADGFAVLAEEQTLLKAGEVTVLE